MKKPSLLAARLLFLLATSITALTATAQSVHPVAMAGQPLVYIKDGNIHSCGIRVMGVEVSNLAVISTIDMSFNLEKSGQGLVKFASGDGDIIKGKPAKRNKLSGAWIKAPGDKATTPKSKVIPGEDGFSILYLTDVRSVIGLFEAQEAGKPLNIGIKKLGESHEKIYAGVAKMDDKEQQQVRQCIRELLSGLSDGEKK